jgi:hypothetical protein
MSDKDKRSAPKPTPSSEAISHGEGSVSDIQNVANDAAEGHAPPVKPQPSSSAPKTES